MRQSLPQQLEILINSHADLSTESLYGIAPQLYKVLERERGDDRITVNLKLRVAREFLLTVSSRLIER